METKNATLNPLKIFAMISLLLLVGCNGATTNQPQSTNPEVENSNQIMSLNETKPETIETPSAKIIEPEVCEIFDNFEQNSPVRWQRVNDNVMGGRSEGDFEIKNNSMILKGSINLNGGGFTSVRALMPTGILEPYNQVVIKAKSDGRGYQLTFRDNNRRGISYQAPLNFSSEDRWQTAIINIADLAPTYFGRKVQADGFNKNQAREIGLILNDGNGGGYQLEIDEIKFCKTEG